MARDERKFVWRTYAGFEDAILSALPDMINRELRKEIERQKWLKRFSGALEEGTEARREGDQVVIYTTPIGKAFDLGGGKAGWKSAAEYVAQLRARGYYKNYMRSRRAQGYYRKDHQKIDLVSGARYGQPRRVPLIQAVVGKVPKMIRQILEEKP
jgi:hypothetical protein